MGKKIPYLPIYPGSKNFSAPLYPDLSHLHSPDIFSFQLLATLPSFLIVSLPFHSIQEPFIGALKVEIMLPPDRGELGIHL